MVLTQRRPQPRRGTAAVEFAIIALFIVPLLIGLWEVGRMVEVEQLLQNAAREGGRAASTGDINTAGVQQIVINELALNGITITTSNVTIVNLTSSSRSDPTTALQLDHFQVSVSVPFNSVRWILLNQITNVKNLTASADWYSMQDVPITVNTTIPLN